MMIKQYPYSLFVSNTVGGGTDENGFPLPSQEVWVLHSKCRDIPAGDNKIKSLESGEMTSYGYKVVMPLGSANLETNKKIEVRDGLEVRVTGNVLRFESKQLHCRIWV